MTEWQPIETAPRDGTPVVLLWGSGSIHSGHFAHTQHYENGKLTREAEHWTGNPWFSTGSTPTHWMPRPPEPVE
jgi:hypothetical protein